MTGIVEQGEQLCLSLESPVWLFHCPTREALQNPSSASPESDLDQLNVALLCLFIPRNKSYHNANRGAFPVILIIAREADGSATERSDPKVGFEGQHSVFQ
jgi:hypothetical protein